MVLAWKTRYEDWSHYPRTLPLLGRSAIDQVSGECPASGVDLAVLEALLGKDVMVGDIDVGTEGVEAPELVAERTRAALGHVDPDRISAGA